MVAGLSMLPKCSLVCDMQEHVIWLGTVSCDMIVFFCHHNSGDPDVESFKGTHLVFIGAGWDPFEVITNSVK